MLLASFFKFSFLCVVAVVNLCAGFAIASWLGWGPAMSALFEFGPPPRLESPEFSADPALAEEPQATADAV